MKTAIELQTPSVSIFLSTHQGIAALTAPPCFSSLNPQISCEAHLSNIHMIMISKLVITKGLRVRATTIEGPEAFALSLCFALIV